MPDQELATDQEAQETGDLSDQTSSDQEDGQLSTQDSSELGADQTDGSSTNGKGEKYYQSKYDKLYEETRDLKRLVDQVGDLPSLEAGANIAKWALQSEDRVEKIKRLVSGVPEETPKSEGDNEDLATELLEDPSLDANGRKALKRILKAQEQQIQKAQEASDAKWQKRLDDVQGYISQSQIQSISSKVQGLSGIYGSDVVDKYDKEMRSMLKNDPNLSAEKAFRYVASDDDYLKAIQGKQTEKVKEKKKATTTGRGSGLTASEEKPRTGKYSDLRSIMQETGRRVAEKIPFPHH